MAVVTDPVMAAGGERPAAASGTGWRLVAAVVLLPAIVAVLLTAFAWPAARTAPRAVPLGLVGPAAALAPLEQRLTDGGAFAVRRYDTEAAARTAIRRRDIYGALVVAPDGTTVLTASAASPVVAQLLQGVAAGAATAPGGATAAPRVIDVVPAAASDPRGAVLGAALFPLLIAGMLIGTTVSLLSGPGAAQLAALLVAVALTALVALGIVWGWLGVLGGAGATIWGVLALLLLALAGTVTALRALLGQAGFGVAGVVLVLIGNPLAGVTSAPELLPRPLGALGQLLPAGAGGSLLRSAGFFAGNGASVPLTVLIAWAAAGMAVTGLAALRGRAK